MCDIIPNDLFYHKNVNAQGVLLFCCTRWKIIIDFCQIPSREILNVCRSLRGVDTS